MKKVLVVGGPTATGKSDLAVELAERFSGEVVNADSVQIYKGMDIGTAKPPLDVRGKVPHHLFDVASPDDPWDVKRYEVEASRVVEDILSRGKLPIVVGGSGFYIKGLVEGVPPDLPSDRNLREKLYLLSREELYEKLRKLDPDRASEIHPNDVKRIVRALEICILTGRPASAFRWRPKPKWDVLKIALDRDREILKKRIYDRVVAMMDAGWLEEVEGLVARYGWDNRILRDTLGYRELIMHLEGELSLDEAVALIQKNTWRYSKRQRTWFRKEGFEFFDAEDKEGIFSRIEGWLSDKNNRRGSEG